MHTTQKHIMSVLMQQSPRRYSELRPKDVEGNVFMHHLGVLIGNGLVMKTDNAYALTTGGKLFVDSLSSETLQPRLQPKIVVDIACQNERGEYLLFRRSKEPFRGLVGFPSGKIHFGETVQ